MTFMGPMNEVAAQDGITPHVAGAHAGEAETSLVLAARDDLVSMDYAEEGFVGDFNEEAAKAIFEQGMIALTSNGILGDARPATAERGFATATPWPTCWPTGSGSGCRRSGQATRGRGRHSRTAPHTEVSVALHCLQVLVEPADDVLEPLDAVLGLAGAREVVVLVGEAHELDLAARAS